MSESVTVTNVSHPDAVVTWRHPYPQGTRLDVFRRQINRSHQLNLKSYEDLYKWSVDNVEVFCREIWEFCGVVHSVPPEKTAEGIHAMWPRPQWFPGARINYTENLLATGLSVNPNRVAISACREGNTYWRHLTWVRLRQEVALYASALRASGVKEGDRVSAILSNSVEAVVLLLATGSIGAIFASTAPDMGAAGIVSRYEQIRPKLLFLDTEVLYAGKRRILHQKLESAVSTLVDRVPELDKIVVITGAPLMNKKCTTLSEFLNVPVAPLRFTQVPFDHPIYILYSSGTTGSPKCICHSGGGALLQQKKELILISNMNVDSVYYQYTTTGWMMWNYLIGSLSVGARIILYDGSPLHPSPASQIELLEKQGVTHWGTSPKLLSTLKNSGWKNKFALENLELVISAGSPLSPEIFRWFHNTFPPRIGLFSGSGGTDLVGSIISGNYLSQIREGELASAALGMKVQIFDPDGQNIDHTGKEGELVITTPFFSMPVTFYGENGHEKYHKAYFDTFPGIWCHGDSVKRNPETGGYVITGRSDGVLNPGGIRFGTAELYSIVDNFSEIEDSIAVGQRYPDQPDEQVLLFLKMKNGNFKATKDRVQAAIGEQLSPRHVPAHVFQVEDIPYTLNGKKMETAVKKIVHKSKIANIDSIANPECLKEYERFADLAASFTTSRL